MNTLSSGVTSVGKGVGDVGSSVGKGVGEVGKGVGNGVGEIGKGVGKGVGSVGNATGDAASGANNGASNAGKGASDLGKGVGEGVGGAAKGAGDAGQGVVKGAGDAGQTAFNGAGNAASGAGDVGKGVGESANKGLGNVTDLVGKGFSNGFQIAGNLSKNAFDLQKNVVQGVAGLGGTAIDGVVTVASATTGAVFDPIANGLKAIEGLEGLGESVDAINGISTKALQGVASVTKEALQVAGKPPTFFDPDADGVVKFTDTKKGFVLLGLEEKYAKIAAYALHSTFSYPTSESWNPVPLIKDEMPIQIANMPKTRWGKNWGNFERVDWVSDTDVETFFGMRERTTWTEYWSDIKSYFGTALLIFEWGTTWPFVIGPAMDAASPMYGQIGAIMRTVILPTIAKSHENAKKAEGNEDGKERVREKMPSPPPRPQASE
ncbi:caleosin domain-containing protein [Moniliophthora roreri MCA 2997]|uniref:Caleosin domain-containing protein n=2 Tax=Moniliophthora roreri TaxID=221103 RepID=V2XG04_MONRO|nr:caleosin domain-containing protein [Moniliophthora roreri MCA 2997]KAI3612901.1 caleosin domain-containing protein [Moniliophthora roreri]